MTFVRQVFKYDADSVSRETGLFCDPAEGLTDPSHKDECDINEIVRRFGITGELPQAVAIPLSGDFTDVVTDFHSAMNMVRSAEEGFMALPADIRQRFGNDPGQLISFLEDDKNREEAEKLGIVTRRVEVSQSVVGEAAPSSAAPAKTA